MKLLLYRDGLRCSYFHPPSLFSLYCCSMLAVELDNGRVQLRDSPRPERPPGFALIRLLCAGICNTDLELQRGYYGFSGTPGHEFVGEVVDADRKELVGRR